MSLAADVRVPAGAGLAAQVARLRAAVETDGVVVPGSPAAAAPLRWLGRQLGGECPLIATATTARTVAEAARQAVAAARAGADVVEVRADLLDAGRVEAESAAAGVGERVGARLREDTGADVRAAGARERAVPGVPEVGTAGVGELAAAYVDAAAQVAASLDGAGVPTPLLLTVRTAGEGGGLAISDEDYAELLTRMLAGLTPGAGTGDAARAGAQADGLAGLSGERSRVVALDVELGRGCLSRLCLVAAQAGVDVVASAHFFDRTPERSQIVELAAQMQRAGAQVAKVAAMPGQGSESADVLTLLTATAQARAALHVPVITMSMGQEGLVTRLAGGLFGSALTFATAGGGASAPGQPPIAQVRAAWRELLSPDVAPVCDTVRHPG